jgi:protein-S-isoprenylcysteine O-methyltransferase Ste14
VSRRAYFLKGLAGISFFSIFMFFAAGTLRYPRGLVFYALSLFGFFANFLLCEKNDSLMEERSRPGDNAKSWDKMILLILTVLTGAAYITAGLDSGRFLWSSGFGCGSMIAGSALVLTGQALFLSAKKKNMFFSSVVRIQNDRNHSVCDCGPYSLVRHPGYLGMIISWAGFCLVMGSVYSVIPAAGAVIVLIVRTGLEDGTLTRELPGYSEYAVKVRARLIPFVW